MAEQQQRRQYWIHDGGEYEYPIAVVQDYRKDPADRPVYLTYDQAERYRKLHADWLRAQEQLWEAYFV